MDECDPVSTPVTREEYKDKEEPIEKFPYGEAVGSLIYLMKT